MKKNIYWIWILATDTVFAKFKYIFISASVLAYFDPSGKTILETDASNWVSRNVLSQYQSDDTLQPIAYFSTKHSLVKCNYEIYDKELLIIIKSLEEGQLELARTSDLLRCDIMFQPLRWMQKQWQMPSFKMYTDYMEFQKQSYQIKDLFLFQSSSAPYSKDWKQLYNHLQHSIPRSMDKLRSPTFEWNNTCELMSTFIKMTGWIGSY